MNRRPRFKPSDRLKVVGKIRDSAGKTYARTLCGMIVRVSPQRPWRGKRGRREHILARRVNRVETW